VPALEVDGVMLAQSLSIARFLGARFGLAGKTPTEVAQVDALVQTIDEMRQPASTAYWTKV
jgi:glutathione S-transferase